MYLFHVFFLMENLYNQALPFLLPAGPYCRTYNIYRSFGLKSYQDLPTV